MIGAKETVEDIVAEFREMVHKSVDGIIAVKADVIADRIDAAWKREAKEIATENAVLPAVCITKSVGNAAAMREALEFCARQMSDAICSKDFGDDVVYLVGCMKTCIEHMKAAISEPPRNCDNYDNKTDAETGFVEETGADDREQYYWQMFANWLFWKADERKGESDGK